MRTSRSFLVGLGALSLVASLSLAVVAQDEEELEPPTATFVTGVAVSKLEDVDFAGWEMEWSDPRLPSRAQYRFSAETGRSDHPDGTVMAAQMVAVVRLDGPDGGWSGTDWILAWTLEPEPGEKGRDTWIEVLMLDGDGDYEGLSATLTNTGRGGSPGPYEGFIFEGELPRMPDRIEPNSE